MHFQPTKLADCRDHANAELLIVEGDSASRSMIRLRDATFQAVLPMQGKPLNANRASPSAVRANPWFAALISAIGADMGPAFDLNLVRFQRIVLVFDPDADGIHCGALMSMFFARFMRPLVEAGRLRVVRTPLFEFTEPHGRERRYAFSEDHFHRIVKQFREHQIEYRSKRFRGLGGLPAQTLRTTCLDPATRFEDPLTVEDAAAAVRVFNPKDG